MSKKLLLIGWDAADWQVIKPLIEQGKMPCLKALMEKGVSGNMATLQPALSPMLWTSIATGKRAYDHGILGFAEYNSKLERVEPIKATKRKVKSFWNILNEAGLKTNVINWWPSHPAEKLNGVSVSNFYHQGAPVYGEQWPMDKSCVFPEELFQKLKDLRLHPGELTLSHIWPFIPEAHKLDPEKDKVLKPLMRVLAHCCSIHNAVTYAMEHEEWDMTAVYYEAIDHFSHLAMKYHPPKLKDLSQEDFDLYKGVVEGAYRFHDMMLERLVELAGPECHIILLSDHGFQSGSQRVLELPDVSAAPALEHRRYGVLLAQGTDFKRNEAVYGASLLDVAPSILQFFDLPIGEDMEGRVISDLWNRAPSISKIPSWELTGKKPVFMTDHFGEPKEEVLQQLQELGYLSIPDNDKERYMNYELQYNLCQSLVDGNKFDEAVELAYRLYQDFNDLRSSLMLAHALLKLGDFERLEKHLEVHKKQGSFEVQLLFIESQLHLYKGKPEKAIEIFGVLEEHGASSTQLFNEMGRSFLIIGVFGEAEHYFNKCLALDNENSMALSGLGQCKVETGDYESAIPFLESSLDQQFFQPNVHYLMGLCLYQLEYLEAAEKALSLALNQGPKHYKAANLLKKIRGEENLKSEPITIVTGFPRSGTSMLMQILHHGGMSILKDGLRKSDDHNPKGYFELEKVKSLGKNADWISEGRGKVIKVVSPLLRYLPANENYKLIWMKRPLTEIIVSQEVMKGRERSEVMKTFPFQMALNLEEEEKRLKTWINQQANMQLLEIEYYDCLNSPETTVGKLNEFLDAELSEAASEAIDKGLHRNKLG